MLFCTDNGGEYTSDTFAEYLWNEGIHHHHTHLLRMENLNVYTKPSWTMCVPFNVTQTCHRTCGGKPWRQWATWKTVHPLDLQKTRPLLKCGMANIRMSRICVNLDAKYGYIYLATLTTQKYTTDQWNAFCWDTLTAPRRIDAFTDQVAVSMSHEMSYLLNHKTWGNIHYIPGWQLVRLVRILTTTMKCDAYILLACHKSKRTHPIHQKTHRAGPHAYPS